MNNKSNSFSYREIMDMAKCRASYLHLQQKLQRDAETSKSAADVTRTEAKVFDEGVSESVNALPAENVNTLNCSNTSFTNPVVLAEHTPDFKKSPVNKISPVSPLKVLEEVYSRYLSQYD